MKAVCAAFGVARSNVHLQAMRADDWIDGRMAPVRDPVADLMLIDAVRAEIVSLPTYGYRRAGALVNRTRSLMSMLPVNHKRFYHAMKEHHLLLPKAPKRLLRPGVGANGSDSTGQSAALSANTSRL